MGKKLLWAIGALAMVSVLLFWDGTPKPDKLDQYRDRDEEPKSEYPAEAERYWAEHRVTRNGENPDKLNMLAMEQTLARRSQGIGSVPNLDFEDIGPGNYGGRIRGIVVHPDNPDIILIGGVLGGVMKTEDGGKSWRGIDDFLPTLAISSMIYDPDTPDTVYAGTGEGFGNGGSGRGIGILRSTDFGETWTLLPSTGSPQPSANTNFHFVNRIAIIPGGGAILAATRAGIFRSSDDGATWNEVSGQNTSSRGFVDLRVDPSDSNRVYASHFGDGGTDNTDYLMRSNDAGLTWTKLGAAEGLPTTDITRMEIGIGSDGVVYVSCSNQADSTRGLWRSPVGGSAFVKTPSNFPYIERQGWYDLMIGVDPSDSDRVYMGAVDVSRTTDAGATINFISEWAPNAGEMPIYVHADIHNIAFNPDDPMTLWIVCDGGIFKSTDGGDTFTPLNNDLRFTQYYGVDVHPDGTRVNGGTQDNGSHLYYGDAGHWPRWFGGDGGFSSWDQQQPQFIYGATPGGGLFGSDDGGSTTAQIGLPSTSGAPFITPFTVDHSDGNRFLVGTNRVYYSENIRSLGGATFIDASGTIGTIRSLAFSPHDPDTALTGTTSGQIHKTTNLTSGSPSFARADTGITTSGNTTWIDVDPFDQTGNTYYATFSGYGPDKVYKTTDGGASWTSIHGDLPNIPVYSVTVARNDPSRIYLGTEIGVFSSDDNADGGAFQWHHLDGGVAFSRVVTIRWTDDHTIWFATHGRGIWKATFNPVGTSIGLADDAECDGDGYLDQGENALLPVTITNNGFQALTGVTANLTSGGDITVSGGAQAFGTINPGESATMEFPVTVNSISSCPETVTFTVDVNYDGGNWSGDHDLSVGTDPDWVTGTFTDGAEGASLMTSDILNGSDGWTQVNTSAQSGSSSWFTSDEAVFSDKVLTSPWMEVQNSNADLGFWARYDTEAGNGQVWDGVMLELRPEDGEWRTLQTSLPYDSIFHVSLGLVGEPCWGGQQTTWRNGSVSLAEFSGRNVQFRFRFASDSNTGGVGFWIDDISVSNVRWLQGLNCDNEVCLTCFPNLAEALQAVLDSAGSGAWPIDDNILDYVATLNNVCAR